jgi:hypothetical protein
MRILNPLVNVPWIGPPKEDGSMPDRMWSTLRFTGMTDVRRVKRSIRKFVWQQLERRLHGEELGKLTRKRRYHLGQLPMPVEEGTDGPTTVNE